MESGVLAAGAGGTGGPTALVRGSSQGIGYETARLLNKRGVRAVIRARDPQRGEAAAGRLGLPFVQRDVTDSDSVNATALAIEPEYGVLDILVNNAGVIGVPELRSSTRPSPRR